MNFIDLTKSRYSVRAYRPDPIEEGKLNQVLTAAQMAPTAANRQPFRLIVINVPGREQDLLKIYQRDWFVQAPIIICACGIPVEGWVRGFDQKNYTDVDVAIVMDHITLAAASLGLGTCWIAAFNPVSAREILKLPEGVEPIVFTPLGYPADQLRPKVRKSLSELIHYEQW